MRMLQWSRCGNYKEKVLKQLLNYAPEIKGNTLEMNDKVGNLNRETEVIKKKKRKQIEAKSWVEKCKIWNKKFTGWAEKQNEGDRGKNKWNEGKDQ